MLVAANAYYLSLAAASAEDARRNTETIEKTIPGDDRPRRQRPAAHGAAAARRRGRWRCAKALPNFASS